MQGLLIDKSRIVDQTQDAVHKIDDIMEKELMRELPYSKVYKTVINGEELVYKIIYKNEHMNFDKVLSSYQNLPYYKDIEALVKVYDYRKADDNSTFEVLMEYLKDYNVVATLPNEKKLENAKQIFSIFNQILNRGFIPVDSGIANFMSDGENVKMIDLDFMLRWKDNVYSNTTWFISRIQQIKDWCPDISPAMDILIKRIVDERKKYFIPYICIFMLTPVLAGSLMSISTYSISPLPQSQSIAG